MVQPRKPNRIATVLTILGAIGIVLLPVLLAEIRVEVAHWYIAAAMNSVELKTHEFDSNIEAARKWYPNLTELPDYWMARLTKAEKEVPTSVVLVANEAVNAGQANVGLRAAEILRQNRNYDSAIEVLRLCLGNQLDASIDYWIVRCDEANSKSAVELLKVLNEAIDVNPRNRALAYEYSNVLAQQGEFGNYVEAVKLFLGKEEITSAAELNLLSYARSLGAVDLDEALEDINKALDGRESDAALRDTRGWVLFRIGKLQEALEDAEYSVQHEEHPPLMTQISRSFSSVSANNSITGRVMFTRDDPTDEDLRIDKLRNENPMTWNLGVMRYHRAKILDGLGRKDEAQKDWDWLKSNDLPTDDRLY